MYSGKRVVKKVNALNRGVHVVRRSLSYLTQRGDIQYTWYTCGRVHGYTVVDTVYIAVGIRARWDFSIFEFDKEDDW